MTMISPPTILALSLLTNPVQGPSEPALPEVLKSWSLQTLTIPQDLPANFEFAVVLGEQTVFVSLHKVTQRSDDFKVLVDEGTGDLVEVAAPAIRTYRGSIAGDPA
ncbi:MAG: hypothetical protein FJ253_03455, partial [Phycisphaerae bacterium]|nr:hypothetical protein [Phycisphaerae bacterium]